MRMKNKIEINPYTRSIYMPRAKQLVKWLKTKPNKTDASPMECLEDELDRVTKVKHFKSLGYPYISDVLDVSADRISTLEMELNVCDDGTANFTIHFWIQGYIYDEDHKRFASEVSVHVTMNDTDDWYYFDDGGSYSHEVYTSQLLIEQK